MPTAKKLTYSESLQELDAILKRFENEDIPLEELSPLVKKAAAIIEKCKEQLFETDVEIRQIFERLE